MTGDSAFKLNRHDVTPEWSATRKLTHYTYLCVECASWDGACVVERTAHIAGTEAKNENSGHSVAV